MSDDETAPAPSPVAKLEAFHALHDACGSIVEIGHARQLEADGRCWMNAWCPACGETTRELVDVDTLGVWLDARRDERSSDAFTQAVSRVRGRVTRLPMVVALALALAAPLFAQEPQALFDRAVADFEAGRLAASVAGFDEMAARLPDVAPQLWQRGIALYYVGRYQDCREQFESHRTVNPNDVENTAWHFLCVARADSPEAARAALLPVGPDPRAPMGEIYQMFRGATTPEAVLRTAGSEARARFYAELYIGLYYEALGTADRALAHLSQAADDRYTSVGGYMHMVARVHVDQLDQR